MKWELWAFGFPKEPYIKLALEKYEKALRPLVPLKVQFLREGRKGGPEERKKEEGERLLKALSPRDWLFLFDERGRQYDSEILAHRIDDVTARCSGRVIFLIGGAWGVLESVQERADEALSFSRMVWPHELALVMAAESLYRSASILKGTGYHHS